VLPEHARELAREGRDHTPRAGNHAAVVVLVLGGRNVISGETGLLQDSISFLDSHL
jgi:hypothetical protein